MYRHGPSRIRAAYCVTYSYITSHPAYCVTYCHISHLHTSSPKYCATYYYCLILHPTYRGIHLVYQLLSPMCNVCCCFLFFILNVMPLYGFESLIFPP